MRFTLMDGSVSDTIGHIEALGTVRPGFIRHNWLLVECDLLSSGGRSSLRRRLGGSSSGTIVGGRYTLHRTPRAVRSPGSMGTMTSPFRNTEEIGLECTSTSPTSSAVRHSG